MGKHPKIWRPDRVNAVIAAACEKYGVSEADIMACKRVQAHIQARRECWWRTRQMLDYYGRPFSYPQIALWFDRDHTTIRDGVRKHEAELKLQAEAKAARDKIFPVNR